MKKLLATLLAIPSLVWGADYLTFSHTQTNAYPSSDHKDFRWNWNGYSDAKLVVAFPVGFSTVNFRLSYPKDGDVYLDVTDGTVSDTTNYTATIIATNFPPNGQYYAEFLGQQSGIDRILAAGRVQIQHSIWQNTSQSSWTNPAAGTTIGPPVHTISTPYSLWPFVSDVEIYETNTVSVASISSGLLTIGIRTNAPGGGSGDITGVIAGEGLTGGGLSGTVTLNVDTNQMAERSWVTSQGYGDVFKGQYNQFTESNRFDSAVYFGAGRYIQLGSMYDVGGTLSMDWDTRNLYGAWVTETTSVDVLKFNTSPSVTSTNTGDVWWNSTENTLNIASDISGVVAQVPYEEWVRAKKNTASGITNGQAVYISGGSGDFPLVELADATSKQEVLGIATHTWGSNDGVITTHGLVRDMDTSAWSVGDVLYVSTSPGVLTNAQQYTGQAHIAHVTRVHATAGTIQVHVGDDETDPIWGAVSNVVLSLTNGLQVTGSNVETKNGYGLSVDQGLTVGTTLSVAGTSTFEDAVTAENGLSVTGGTISGDGSGITNLTELDPNFATVSNLYSQAAGIVNSLSVDQQACYVTNVAGTVYFETELVTGGDVEFFFDDTILTLDCTTGAGIGGRARVQLTPGTDSSPIKNWVYVTNDNSAAYLAAGTAFPSGEFSMLASVTLKSAATTLTDGPFAMQRWTDTAGRHGAASPSGRGHVAEIAERVRMIGAQWDSGCNVALNEADSTTLYAGTDAGVVYQLHRQTWGAVDTNGTASWEVMNHWATNYTQYTDLADIGQVSDGTSIPNNRFYAIRLYGYVASGNDGQNRYLVSLPDNFYLNQDGAVNDSSGYDNNNVPAILRGGAFNIARIVLQRLAGGSYTVIETQDTLGIPVYTAGGVGGTSGSETDPIWAAASNQVITVTNISTATAGQIVYLDGGGATTGYAAAAPSGGAGGGATFTNAFSVATTGTVEIAASTYTTAPMGTTDGDLLVLQDSSYNTNTYTWTPSVGWCYARASMGLLQTHTDGARKILRLYRNGTTAIVSADQTAGGTRNGFTASWFFYNASSTNQYVLQGWSDDASATGRRFTSQDYFGGYCIQP